MDVVAAWSQRIAERVTPAESGSAARVGAAYVAGGRRRRELFAGATGGGGGAEAAGFGGGAGMGELPFILDGLRYVADRLLDLLAGHPLADLLLLLAIRRATGPVAPGHRGGAPGTAPDAAPDAAPDVRLGEVIDGLAGRLRAQGISPERARQLTYDTLKLVFQHDRETTEIDAFLRALAAGPPAEPAAGDAARAAPGRSPAVRSVAPGWMLPPWLWLYFLGVAAPSVPGLMADVQADADGIALLVGQLTDSARGAATAVLTGAGLLEFFPALLLLAGIAGVLFPGVRGRFAERRHRLAPDDGPVMAEMTAYVRRHAPAVELRLGERHDRLARVYPIGWRAARVAVYPPLLRLWHHDRAAAHAVLLHEVAHLRQGDHLIVGLASPFVWFVRIWSVALTVLVLVPVTFYAVTGGPGTGAALAALLYDAAAVPIGLILPVAGLWVAELGADRLALQEVGPDALRRALGPRPARRRPITRLLDGLTHPPLRLRRWAADRWPGGTAAVAALWPAAVVVRIAAITVVQALLYLLTGATWPESLSATAGAVQAGLAAAQVTLLEMIVLLVNWPLLAPVWTRIWTPVRAVRHRFAPYLLSALIPGALMTGGLAGAPSGDPGADAARAVAPSPAPAVPARPDGSRGADPSGGPDPADVPVPGGTPERTGLVDDRPWAGQTLPAHLRITAFATLAVLADHPSEPGWKGTAAGLLGSGVWRAERDGRLTFTTLADRPGLRPGTGQWLRMGDMITFWQPVELDVAGTPVATEISGQINLARAPVTMEALWSPVPTSSNGAGLGTAPVLRFAAPLDVYTAP
jgi:Zn-dependent protease with chaperone function